MIRRFFLLLAAAIPALALETDVVVYGGSAAGVSAAVQAARMGRSVLLVAPERHAGGMPVEGLGSADINNHWFRNDTAVGGIAREFYLRLGQKYGIPQPVYRYEAHVAESVMEELLRDAKVQVRLKTRIREPLRTAIDWEPNERRIRAIVAASGERFEGKVFVDATIEGDLLAAAGIPMVTGRESNSKYGETKNGIRGETTHAQFAVRVDPYRIPGDPKSGLIATIQDEPLGTPGAGDNNIQAFCFRLCLTRDPANRILIERPEGLDRSQYEIYFRYVQAGGKLWTPAARLPNGKTDLGSWHDLSANLYGMNREWPNGDYRTRERIYQEHRQFTHGLLWLLANDPEMPAALRGAWKEWGLCKDEFTDNGGWPRQLYVREGRRMLSDYVITERHTRRINPQAVPDPVAVAFWPTDTHSVRRIVRDGAAYNEGFVFDDNDWGPFGISYRAMVPRKADAINLLTPTALSATHVAYGAIRLEQTFLSLGQAAGAAAALAAANGIPIQEVDYPSLRERLIRDGQVVAVSLVPSKDGTVRDR